MSKYKLYVDPQECDSDDWPAPDGRFITLRAAMRAAGHPDPADWGTSPHCPDEVSILEPVYLAILAPGAAARLRRRQAAAGRCRHA
jgi:hypothetical protein